MASASAPFMAVAGVCWAEERAGLGAEPRAWEGLKVLLREGREGGEARVLSGIEGGEVEKGLDGAGFRAGRVEDEDTQTNSMAALKKRETWVGEIWSSHGAEKRATATSSFSGEFIFDP